MAEAQTWSGVQVNLQSALGAVIALSAISKAAEAVATSAAAHGLTTGDYVVVSAQGMSQVDSRVFRVTSLTSTTFTLDDEDSTLYTSFSTGSCQKVTFGTSIATMTDLSSSGGEPEFKSTTTIHDLQARQVSAATSAITYSFSNIWDLRDPGLKALEQASRSGRLYAMQFVFRNGDIVVFTGTVTATRIPTGTAQDVIKTPASISMNGVPTSYAA